jgi:N,N'-diacetylbacillosaminyl-diphospho-undecaprenol alpha-1,3-N-acetylgalactosaminyltransferase
MYSNRKKIAIICNTDGALYNFRKPLIEFHLLDGFEVQTFSNNYGNYFTELKKLGCVPNLVNFNHKNSFFENLSVIKSSISLIKKFNPDIIHIYTLQPIVLLSIPLRLMGFNCIFSTVTGMGRNFDISDKKLSRKQKVILFILKISFLANRKIQVQNNYDKEFLIYHNVVQAKKIIKVNGSGMSIINRNEDLLDTRLASDMNLDNKLKELYNLKSNKRIILYASRGLKEKGLFHFADASKIVSEINSDFQFVHVGGYPEFMAKDEYEKFANEHNYLALGYIKEIELLFRISDVVVLPSIYREGIPKSLIEAVYYNKIIITNDIPGCDETVIDGANGWLCKAGNTNDFVSKILKINQLDVALVKKTNDFLINKFDVEQLYEQNKLMYNEKL